MLEDGKIKFGIALQLIVMLSMLAITSSMFSSWLAYENSKTQLEESLGKELLSLVNSVAPFISGNNHENIVRIDKDFIDGQENFDAIRRQLTTVKKTNDLQLSTHDSPLYTLRKSSGFKKNNMLEFVVMTDADKNGNFFIGNRIPSELHHLEALSGNPTTTGLYEDSEGIWISAAAPIYDSNNNIVGILQADRHVSFFYKKATELAKKLFLGSAIIIIIAIAIGTLYSRKLTRAIKSIVEAARLFGKGEYKQTIEISRKDEIGFLATVFNKMSLRIRQAQSNELKKKSALQKLSKELANANKNLEHKVAERTKQLTENHAKLAVTLKSLKKSQATLVQSEKMASLGQLAAGIAHEINNPMAFITSNMATLKDYTDSIIGILDKVTPIIEASKQEDKASLEQAVKNYTLSYQEADMEFLSEDIGTLLDDSLNGATRVKDIVANLKGYSQVDSEEFGNANINECLESTLEITQNEAKYNCEIIKDFSELPDIQCNARKLNQVFTNLIVNGAQAMKENGKLIISTQTTGAYVVIKVADIGKGIPKENLEKIFDAFFTTKPVGDGTGLGLYISYNIIQEHNGDMTVDSEIGKGTTFTIKLPINQGWEH